MQFFHFSTRKIEYKEIIYRIIRKVRFLQNFLFNEFYITFYILACSFTLSKLRSVLKLLTYIKICN